MELAESGVLEEHGVELIGARLEAIRTAEDRELFKKAMDESGLEMPAGHFVHSVEEAAGLVDSLGYPAIIRPSYTLGGSGGGIAHDAQEFEAILRRGLDLSPITEVLIEESVLGWKEFELEVMRDLNDNVVIICSIENLDPMGVHTGDSITVAPAQTLSDKEYQEMRDAAIRVIRKIGVDTGGSNIQFAVDPETGRMVVIEMNPRVSRSSALASKATGFPIAKIAAKLAVGYTLDEIPNDITRETPASFEPTIDYVVTKIPRWAFEKFPSTPDALDTPDALGGRDDGRGPHLCRVLPERPAVAGDRPGRLGRRRQGRGSPGNPRCRDPRAPGPSELAEVVPSQGRPAQGLRPRRDPPPQPHRSLVHRPPGEIFRAEGELRQAREGLLGDGERLRAAKALGFSGPPAGLADGARRVAGSGGAPGEGCAPRFQDRRHLRGRVRGPHARTTTPRTSAKTSRRPGPGAAR